MTTIDRIIDCAWVLWRRAIISYYAASGRSEQELLTRLRSRRW